jgi:predicted Zn-dependent protease with MMP-like domain
MTRDEFANVVAEVLDSLPDEFRRRIRNVAVLVEDYPPGYEPVPRRAPRPRDTESHRPRRLLLGQYIGVPATQRSVFDLRTGPDHIVLYQKNIEAVCRTEQELRDQIKLTVMHELGHYFGMSEDQLRDV